MRILIVHNQYREVAGEEAAVANERALLEGQGYHIKLWSVSNDSISGTWARIATAVRTPYSRVARNLLANVICEFSPRIVHVHNFFPLITPSVYDAARSAGVAVVQTLHNYRTICANAALSRNGHPCEDCIGGTPYQAVLHRCYRGSLTGSLAVARMISSHRRRGTWLRKVDRFIALSEFAKGRFVAAGFPVERIAVKPNFAEDPGLDGSTGRAGAIYVGRLGFEKGIGTLLRAWDNLDFPLTIVGDGPLRGMIEEAKGGPIAALGRRPPTEVRMQMARAAFLVLPSEVYENFPLVIAEAFCQGLPVIAARIGALAEIVEEGSTGLLFSAGDADDLKAKVLWAQQHSDAMRQMGDRARRVYEERYSPAVNFARLAEIYQDAIKQSQLP